MVQSEIKLMKAAIALSEELNFLRAARKLRISQPTLTRQILDLEKRLGFPLFERNHKKVQINDAGRAFVAEARLSLLHFERAIHAANAAMQDAEVVLNVGRSPFIDPFLVSVLLSTRPPLFPTMRIELTSRFSGELVHEVLNGNLDLAFVANPPDTPLLTAQKIAQSPFYLAMSQSNTLAKHSSIALSALAGRCWALFDRHIHPPLYDTILELARKQNVTPSTIHHVMSAEEAFQLISDQDCVAFLTKAGALRIAHSGITIRPFQSDLSIEYYIASRADNQSKALSDFTRAFVRKLSSFSADQQFKLPIAG